MYHSNYCLSFPRKTYKCPALVERSYHHKTRTLQSAYQPARVTPTTTLDNHVVELNPPGFSTRNKLDTTGSELEPTRRGWGPEYLPFRYVSWPVAVFRSLIVDLPSLAAVSPGNFSIDAHIEKLTVFRVWKPRMLLGSRHVDFRAVELEHLCKIPNMIQFIIFKRVTNIIYFIYVVNFWPGNPDGSGYCFRF